MWFKNLALLRFTEAFAVNALELAEKLGARKFKPCGSLDLKSLGFVPPIGPEDDSPLVHPVNGRMMFCIKTEEKILPGSVVDEILSERSAEFEEKQGRAIRRKERDALRDEILQDLLPRAFSHSKRLYAYIDPAAGYLIVDSASQKKAEEVASLLRQCLGSLPVVPVVTQSRPSAILTGWLDGSFGVPQSITIETDCELRSPDEDNAVIRCKNQNLEADEVTNHIGAGKEVIKLALTWNDLVSFVLDEAFGIKRLRFLDGVQEDAANVETETPEQRFDADFAIMAPEIRALIAGLIEAFGGIAEAKP